MFQLIPHARKRNVVQKKRQKETLREKKKTEIKRQNQREKTENRDREVVSILGFHRDLLTYSGLCSV